MSHARKARFKNPDVRAAFVSAVTARSSFLDLVGMEICDNDVEALITLLQDTPSASSITEVDAAGAKVSKEALTKLQQTISRAAIPQAVPSRQAHELFLVEVDALHIAQHNARVGLRRIENGEWASLREHLQENYDAAMKVDRQNIYAQRVLSGAQRLLHEVREVRHDMDIKAAMLLVRTGVELEAALRQDLAIDEETARKGLQRAAFRSFDFHKGNESARLGREADAREALVCQERSKRALIENLRSRCWMVYVQSAKDEDERMDSLREATARSQEEDRKRHSARVADLEAKREHRRDRLVKDEQRITLKETHEKEQLMRVEAKQRLKIMEEHEEVISGLLFELFKLQKTHSLKILAVGKLLRERDALLRQEVVVSVNGVQPMRSVFPLRGYMFPVCPNVEVTSAMPPTWGKAVEAATTAVQKALHEYTSLRSHDSARERDLLKQIEALAKVAGIYVDYRTSLLPTDSYVGPVGRSILSKAQTIPLRTAEECLRRKGTLWGGSIKATHTAREAKSWMESKVKFKCTELLSDYYDSTGEVHIIDIPPCDEFTLHNVSVILSSLTLAIDSVTNPDPNFLLMASVEIELSLRYANLVDAADELPVPSAVYFVHKTISLPFLLCRPFIENTFTGLISWEQGSPDVYCLNAVTVGVAPMIALAPNQNPPYQAKLRDASHAAFEGGRLTVRFLGGYSVDDRIMFAPPKQVETNDSTQPQVQSHTLCTIHHGVCRVGEESIGTIIEGHLSRPKDTGTPVKPCQKVVIALKGPGSTPSNVQSFIRCLKFGNYSKEPSFGVRQIAVEVTDNTYACCFALAKVNVLAKELPTTLTVPTLHLVYHSVCHGGECPEALINYIQPHNITVAADAVVADLDTDHFVGGNLTVRITSGLMRGDDLYFVPSLPENAALREGDIPEPVGIYLYGDRVCYNGVSFGNVMYVANESQEPKKLKKKIELKKVIPKVVSKSPTEDPLNMSLTVTDLMSTVSLVAQEALTSLNVGDYDAQLPVANGEITFVFDKDGSPRVCGVHELLRCIHYRNFSYLPKPGKRSLEIILNVGPTFQRRTVDGVLLGPEELPYMNETLRAEISLEVSAPLFKVAIAKGSGSIVRYLEGQGPKRLFPFDLASSDEALIDYSNGANVRIEIVEGANAEDVIWMSREVGIELVNITDMALLWLERSRASRKNSVPRALPLDHAVPCNSPRATPRSPDRSPRSPDRSPRSPILTSRKSLSSPLSPTRTFRSPTHFSQKLFSTFSFRFGWFNKDSQSGEKECKENLHASIQRFLEAKVQRKKRLKAAMRDFLDQTKRIGKAQKSERRTADLYYSSDVRAKKHIGTITSVDKTKLEISFFKQTVGGHTLSRKDLTAIIRAVTYENTSKNIRQKEKKIRMTLADSTNTYTQGMIMLVVQTVDDPPELHIKNERVRYRQGTDSSINGFAIVPIGQGCVFDPDTEYFDGGCLTVELIAGGHRGDALGLLTPAQQYAMYQKLGQHPKYILTLEGTELRTLNGVIIADVEYLKNQFVHGTYDISLKFRDHKPKLVSIDLVTFMLNIVTYTSTTIERVKENLRQYRITITDVMNPNVFGRTNVSIDVQSALCFIPNFSTSLSVGLEEEVSILSKCVCPDKVNTLTTGFIDIRVVQGDDLDDLHFGLAPPRSPSSPGLKIKSPKNDQELFGEAVRAYPRTGESFMTLSRYALVENGSTIGRVTTCTNKQITISIHAMSFRALEHFLRSICYIRRTEPIEGGKMPVIPAQMRKIVVTVGDGLFDPNVLTITVNLH